MTLTEDMTIYLASKGLGTKAVNLFESEFPPTPTNAAPDWPGHDAMYVREYGGRPPLHAKNTGPLTRFPRFSVVCRSKSARAARMRCEDALKHLSKISGSSAVVNGTAYSSVRATREPAPMGRDDAGRERVVCDFEAIR